MISNGHHAKDLVLIIRSRYSITSQRVQKLMSKRGILYEIIVKVWIFELIWLERWFEDLSFSTKNGAFQDLLTANKIKITVITP